MDNDLVLVVGGNTENGKGQTRRDASQPVNIDFAHTGQQKVHALTQGGAKSDDAIPFDDSEL